MAKEPEHEQEVQEQRRKDFSEIAEWVRSLTSTAELTGVSEMEIAAWLIRTGGADHGFEAPKANRLIQATRYIGRAKKAGEN